MAGKPSLQSMVVSPGRYAELLCLISPLSFDQDVSPGELVQDLPMSSSPAFGKQKSTLERRPMARAGHSVILICATATYPTSVSC
jgi:hypothetical protein